jgi:hypothetical protein
MTEQKHTIFPIKFTYNGVGFETKALKHAYYREVLYKIALPSAVSPVQQCWVSLNNDGEWKFILGNVDDSLIQQMITSIQKQEQVLTIYTQAATSPELKSA